MFDIKITLEEPTVEQTIVEQTIVAQTAVKQKVITDDERDRLIAVQINSIKNVDDIDCFTIMTDCLKSIKFSF